MGPWDADCIGAGSARVSPYVSPLSVLHSLPLSSVSSSRPGERKPACLSAERGYTVLWSRSPVRIRRTTPYSYPSDEETYVFLIREGNRLRVETDTHHVGLYDLEEIVDAIRQEGFEPQVTRLELSDLPPDEDYPLVTAVRRG